MDNGDAPPSLFIAAACSDVMDKVEGEKIVPKGEGEEQECLCETKNADDVATKEISDKPIKIIFVVLLCLLQDIDILVHISVEPAESLAIL